MLTIRHGITMFGRRHNDGDTISMKPIFTVEANQDAENRINSKGYVLNISGQLMRGIVSPKQKQTFQMQIKRNLYMQYKNIPRVKSLGIMLFRNSSECSLLY